MKETEGAVKTGHSDRSGHTNSRTVPTMSSVSLRFSSSSGGINGVGTYGTVVSSKPFRTRSRSSIVRLTSSPPIVDVSVSVDPDAQLHEHSTTVPRKQNWSSMRERLETDPAGFRLAASERAQ